MPDTYGGVEAVYKTTYQANVELAIQQKTPKLVPLTTPIPKLSGKEAQVVELVGSSDAIEDAPDSGDTPHIAPKHLGIYVQPRRIIWGRSIPSSTAIKAAVDYQSTYVQEGAAAVVRSRDKFVMQAAYGSRYLKYDADTMPVAVPFDAARIMPVNYGGGADTGLTVKKFVGAVSMLMAAEIDVDSEDLVCWITSKQNESLYEGLQVTSKEYRDKAIFEDKRVVSFMNVRLQHFEKLPLASAGVRSCMFYAKSGLHSGDAMPVTTQIEKNPNRQYQPHPFIETWFGGTRSEDEKFVQILCKE